MNLTPEQLDRLTTALSAVGILLALLLGLWIMAACLWPAVRGWLTAPRATHLLLLLGAGMIGASALWGWSHEHGAGLACAMAAGLCIGSAIIILLRTRDARPLLREPDAQGTVHLLEACTICYRDEDQVRDEGDTMILPNLCDHCGEAALVHDCPCCGESPDGRELGMGMELACDEGLYQVTCLYCGYAGSLEATAAAAVRTHNQVMEMVILGRAYTATGGTDR